MIYSKTSLARHHRYQAKFWREARWRVNGSDLLYNTRQENTGPQWVLMKRKPIEMSVDLMMVVTD